MSDLLNHELFQLIDLINSDSSFTFSAQTSSKVLTSAEIFHSPTELVAPRTLAMKGVICGFRSPSVDVLRKYQIKIAELYGLTTLVGTRINEATFKWLPSHVKYIHFPSCQISEDVKFFAEKMIIERTNIMNLSMLDGNEAESLYLTGNVHLLDLRGVPGVIRDKLILTDCISIKTFEFLPSQCRHIDMRNVGKHQKIDRFLNILMIEGLETISALDDKGPCSILEQTFNEVKDPTARIYASAMMLIENGHEDLAAV